MQEARRRTPVVVMSRVGGASRFGTSGSREKGFVAALSVACSTAVYEAVMGAVRVCTKGGIENVMDTTTAWAA